MAPPSIPRLWDAGRSPTNGSSVFPKTPRAVWYLQRALAAPPTPPALEMKLLTVRAPFCLSFLKLVLPLELAQRLLQGGSIDTTEE